jgi:hypothetical protein
MTWIEQFIRWFQGLGGTLPSDFREAINDRYIYDPPKVSSLKDKAGNIKDRYNHKFVKKSPVDEHPDISKIKFEKNE